jgi:outer membrane protein OmpA-like peptidoglycan-associated protein
MKTLLLSLFVLISLNSFAQGSSNVCSDHPMVSRFPDSDLIWCDTQTFSNYSVAIGKLAGYRNIDQWIELEGNVSRYNYELNETEVTMSEVYQNYHNALKRNSFTILAAGFDPNRTKKREVGGNIWVGVAFIKNALPMQSRSKLFKGSSSSGGYGYIAAKLDNVTGNVYAVIAVYQQEKNRVVTQIDIIEEQVLEDFKIEVDADYIAREITRTGSVSLYGVYFDFDKAEVKSESDPTLKAIADYLKAHPDVQLYVVGHTDLKGTLEYNLKLAKLRSEAIVQKLTVDYKIDKSRLIPESVGPLAPKSTNDSDDGRRLNRRVELVKR